MVERPVDMLEYLPLPYDDELSSPVNEISSEDFYKQTIESGYLNSQWWNN